MQYDEITVPHMLSVGDVDAINKYVKPHDHVLELGCWLGGSTRCFLDITSKVSSCDKFIWQQYMERRVPGYYDIGDTFLMAWFVNTHYSAQAYTRGVEKYNGNDPVDVLFIDAWKHMSIMMSTQETVFPTLKLGSLILDQDFFYDPLNYAYAYALYYERRDCFRPVEHVPQSDMMVFEVVEVPYGRCDPREVSLSEAMHYALSLR